MLPVEIYSFKYISTKNRSKARALTLEHQNMTRDLEIEMKIQIIIIYSVTDGKYTATTILSVNITDVNDEAPAFDEASYAKDVLETQNAGVEWPG